MKKTLLILFCMPFLAMTQNSHTINTLGSSFSPASLIINVGDTVTWNNTAGWHNVNATQGTFPNNPEGFGNSVAAAGWSFQWIFTLAGTYDYQCDPHAPAMSGVIIANAMPVPGCTDPTATNYDPTATVDDGSCLYFTLATDLFISEYAEGSGTNKYIEIFNGTGQNVDLSNYALWKVTNGGTWPEATLSLSGNLADGHVYIIYSSSSTVDPVITAAGDITWSQVTWTGDDAVGLAKQVIAQSGSTFSLIDVIGEDGPDPGNGWNVAGVTDATKDHTLVRKCSITQGNINWNLSSGTNAQDSEWEVFSQNYWSDIDQHTFPCQSATVYGCMDSTALNYDPLATIDDGSCISLTFGCTDSTAFNYNATANSDDGSCCFQSGCTNPIAFNYDPSACYNDGSCITPNFGCMNASAMNFDSTATIDDGTCIYLADKIDLFFSEYGEGSSNNKYLEIYNSTVNPVNLSSYALTRVSNAPTTVGVYEYWVNFDSAAVILANDVYIVAHPSADFNILAQADMTYSSLSNGDDGFALVYGGKPSSPVLPGNEYIILDFLGDFNGDPGSGWSVAGESEATKDHVLIRKCDINTGNIDWTTSAGTDSLNSEWIVLSNEDWSDIGQHTFPCLVIDVYGCTDSTATNYDPLATVDDSSCTYVPSSCASLSPTGAYISELIHDRIRINWDNMNDTSCMVTQYRIRYRELGTSTWLSKTMANSGLCLFGLNTTSKKVVGLTPSTTYEYYMKAWYCGGSTSTWSATQNFTTTDECENVINFAVSTPTTTKASFSWDTTAAYSFARIKLRVDTTGGVWTSAGGFGVFYPALTKDKNGLTPGTSYRAQARTWCDPSGGAYRSASWSPLVFWTQPTTVKLAGESLIANLAIYPNPSRDIFNVSFISDTKQNLKVKILNIIGEELINENLEQFIGEYTKQINLSNKAKGIYFLEIETNDGIINKKLILQ
jgi:plastocyanin